MSKHVHDHCEYCDAPVTTESAHWDTGECLKAALKRIARLEDRTRGLMQQLLDVEYARTGGRGME